MTYPANRTILLASGLFAEKSPLEDFYDLWLDFIPNRRCVLYMDSSGATEWLMDGENITFQEVFELMPRDIQERLIMHLDIFMK